MSLTKAQILRIQSILEKIDGLPSGKIETLNVAVYDQLFELYQVNIYVNYDDDLVSIHLASGEELTGIELDRKLSEIQRNNHIARAPKGDNFNSITTISNGPSGKILNSAIENKDNLIPKGKLISIANQAMQDAEVEMSNFNEIQMREHVEYTMLKAEFCRKIAVAKNVQTYRDLIGKAETTFANKKLSKLDKWKLKEKAKKLKAEERAKLTDKKVGSIKLTSDQKFMKTVGLDWNKPEDLIKFKELQQRMTSK